MTPTAAPATHIVLAHFLKLAHLVGREEGFGIPGTIPTVRHNPGDLRHSPHTTHAPGDPNGIGYEPSNEIGWQDLERQIQLDAGRGLTLAQFIAKFAPPNENNTSIYLQNICLWARVNPSTPLSQMTDADLAA